MTIWRVQKPNAGPYHTSTLAVMPLRIASGGRRRRVHHRTVLRMMDVEGGQRLDRTLAEQRFDVIDEPFAFTLVRNFAADAFIERTADDDAIRARKHVSVLAVKILQVRL